MNKILGKLIVLGLLSAAMYANDTTKEYAVEDAVQINHKIIKKLYTKVKGQELTIKKLTVEVNEKKVAIKQNEMKIDALTKKVYANINANEAQISKKKTNRSIELDKELLELYK